MTQASPQSSTASHSLPSLRVSRANLTKLPNANSATSQAQLPTAGTAASDRKTPACEASRQNSLNVSLVRTVNHAYAASEQIPTTLKITNTAGFCSKAVRICC